MEGKMVRTSRFFKVMMPGFQEKLNLPPAISTNLKESESERAILRSRRGAWRINLSRDTTKCLISFKDGWPQFVRHHGLSIGDFVVFEHIGDFHFNAFVFDRTACEKEFLVQSKKKEHDVANGVIKDVGHTETNSRDQRDRESAKSYDSENPHFVLEMKPHHAGKSAMVNIPANFLRSNEIRHQNGSKMILRDPRGKEWPLTLFVERSRPFHVRMCKGWHDFYVSNDLKDGDVCSFYVDRKSLKSTIGYVRRAFITQEAHDMEYGQQCINCDSLEDAIYKTKSLSELSKQLNDIRGLFLTLQRVTCRVL
ncbi:hypothetical protein OROGR_018494 [Orobanche gracilis]